MIVPKAKRLQNGLYAVRLRVNGQTITVHGATEAAAAREARKIKSELQTERKVEAGTVGACIDRYIQRYAPVLSPSTVRAYKAYRKNRFVSVMDAMPERVDWQREINAESRRVSPKTVKNAWGLIEPALREAGYHVPPVKLPQVPVKEIAFLQPEEIKPFMDALRGKSYELPVLMELHGLRYSEVCAMTWDKVKDGTITVSGSMVRGENGMEHKPTNKNRSSSRTIPLLIPRIEELRGQPFYRSEKNLREDVQRTCAKAGVTVITNHGLRHTFASLCYHLDIPAMQAAEWGGWSNLSTMTKVYTRLANSSKRHAAERMLKFFSSENATENGTDFANP